MPLVHNLEQAHACQAKGPVYATPHVLKSWQNVVSLEALYLGTKLPDVSQPKYIVGDIISRLEHRRTPRSLQNGLMAIEIVKLCQIDHHNPRKDAKPILERVGSYVLAAEGAEPFNIKATHKLGQLVVIRDPLIEGTGLVRPIAVLDATEQETNTTCLTQAIRSAPLAGVACTAFVALRGHEELVYLDNKN